MGSPVKASPSAPAQAAAAGLKPVANRDARLKAIRALPPA